MAPPPNPLRFAASKTIYSLTTIVNMKSAEGNVEQTTPSKREIDIQPMANLILETLAALGRPYGMNYIAQFLTADRFLPSPALH